MAVAVVLWSSTLTTAKFSPRVPHLLETGENFGLLHFLICILVLLLRFCTSELQRLMFYFLGKGVECLEFVMGSPDSQIDTRVRGNCVFCTFAFSQKVNIVILSGESGGSLCFL